MEIIQAEQSEKINKFLGTCKTVPKDLTFESQERKNNVAEKNT